MSKPKRDDECYKEIENFKDYELTNCIAYEMAIRNNDFIAKAKEFNCKLSDLDKKLKKELPAFEEKYRKENNITIVSPVDGQWLQAIASEIGQEYQEFHDSSKKEALEKFGIQYSHLNNPLIVTKVFKGTTKTNQVIENKSFLRNKTEVRFSRPKLDFRNMKTTEVKFNMALPKEELIAYATKAIEQAQANLAEIKTPYELFGIEYEVLDIANNLPKNNEKDKKIQEILADRFFVYHRFPHLEATRKRLNNIKKAILKSKLKEIHKKDNLDRGDRNNLIEETKKDEKYKKYTIDDTELKIQKEIDLYHQRKILHIEYNRGEITEVELHDELKTIVKDYYHLAKKANKISRARLWLKQMIDKKGYKTLLSANI